MKGKVYLIGAGPGDPRLMTIRGLEALGESDAVVYDRLINPGILSWAKEGAELINVGKARGKHSWTQAEINGLLAEEASKGKIVARLKGGDPFVLGRGGEEALALARKDIPFEVIPGVSSAIAAPAYAGIPVTHRKISSCFAVITGHEDPTKEESSLNWEKLATGVDTLIFLMGVENLPYIISNLIKNGRPENTPAAIICQGTLPSQRTVVGNLKDIVKKANRVGLESPAIIVVGEVVSLRDGLRWYDNKPLFGKRVLVTRPHHQARELSQLLEGEGALVLEAPMVEIKPKLEEVNGVPGRLPDFNWLVFTSANGVTFFFNSLENKGLDARALSHLKICAIGLATAKSLALHGIKADLIPEDYSTEGILAKLREREIKGNSFLLLRADLATDELEDALRSRGARVEKIAIYRTSLATEIDEEIKGRMIKDGVDIIIFTSSSTVKGFCNLMGDKLEAFKNAVVACIGPVTASTALEMGLKVDVIAEEHTVRGLINALKEYIANSKQ